MATDILAFIDGALADYAVSKDAMRWTPDPPSPPRPVFVIAPNRRWFLSWRFQSGIPAGQAVYVRTEQQVLGLNGADIVIVDWHECRGETLHAVTAARCMAVAGQATVRYASA